MTPQPAPGAAVVQRDARTIPRCERRDGHRIATPTSDEVPIFEELRASGKDGAGGGVLAMIRPFRRLDLGPAFAALVFAASGCGPSPAGADGGLTDSAIDAAEWVSWRAESISDCEGPPPPVWLPRDDHAPGEFLWARTWPEIRRDPEGEIVLRPPYALTGRTPLLAGDGFVTFTWRENETDMRLLARDGAGSGGGGWWVSLDGYRPVGRMWLANGHTYGIAPNSLTATVFPRSWLTAEGVRNGRGFG